MPTPFSGRRTPRRHPTPPIHGGRVVAVVRGLLGLEARHLADAAGLSQSSLCRLERAQRGTSPDETTRLLSVAVRLTSAGPRGRDHAVE